MTLTIPIHVTAGLIGITAGAVALFALKGAKLHRKSGMIFVVAMLVMGSTGAVMAAMQPSRLSVIAGVLTFYLVTTGLLTVKRPASGSRWLDVGAMLLALAIGVTSISFGVQALSSGTGTIEGIPAPIGFKFGTVALLAALGDLRMLRRGIEGARRIARHLWRMCFAMYIATASFFLGQPQVFPESLRSPALRAIPVLLVVVLMFYWLGRLRLTKKFPGARQLEVGARRGDAPLGSG